MALATPYPQTLPTMSELTGTQLLDLIDGNADWLSEAEDPTAMLSALIAVQEKQVVRQPVAA